MKTYEVVIAPKAEGQLLRHLRYIEDVLRNPQAAQSVYLDFMETARSLSVVAGAVKASEDDLLKSRGLMRWNFQKHQYFLLFKVEDDAAIVTNVYHFRENYLAKLE